MRWFFLIILSVDLGKSRTGIAACDKTMLLAYPVCVIEERNREKLAGKINDIICEKKAELVVIGLPKNMDGSEGESAKNARDFAQNLSEICRVPVKMYDERCTTMIAHKYFNDTDTRGKKRKQNIDSASATVILQSYIDYLKNSQNS